MSDYYLTPDQRTVLRALEVAQRRGSLAPYRAWPEGVALHTPAFMSMGAAGRRPPMGERKVRELRNALRVMGLVDRVRSHYGGHAFSLTDEGTRLLDSR